ncbi:unnamed protein product [Durusdinium trenchii]|uniref:Uncharacterized protein n=1 Tax=Durusdinium trenchii TaxID=1381693 RepID=A0ABP0R6I4_9DINO
MHVTWRLYIYLHKFTITSGSRYLSPPDQPRPDAFGPPRSATSAATRTPIRSLERTAIQTFDDEDEKFIRMLINMCWGGEEKLSSCIRNGCNKKWKASEYQVIVIHSGHTDISTTIRDEDEMVSFELFPKDGNTIDIHIFCKV